jgi:Bifunctional DNA primase/polymerase, N-terminal
VAVDRGVGIFTSRYWRALTRTAVSAVAAGLPVVPGAWWSAADRRFECDLAGCGRTGPHPAVRLDSPNRLLGSNKEEGLGQEGLLAHALRHPEAVAARWRQQPYAVLVPTGESCDVVDVPASLGRAVAARLDARSALGPLIAAGTRWFFVTAPGGQRSPQGGDVLVHGQGSWIMLPPSLGPAGEPASWLVKPPRTNWPLPSRDDVIAALPSLVVPAPRATPRSSLIGRTQAFRGA